MSGIHYPGRKQSYEKENTVPNNSEESQILKIIYKDFVESHIYGHHLENKNKAELLAHFLAVV